MTPTIRRKLEQLAERHQELEHLMASAEVGGDPKRLREVSQEHARLSPLTATLAAFDEIGGAID
ncbi:MAG: peptide chain release factor 1, partial [Dokdonella sp.]